MSPTGRRDLSAIVRASREVLRGSLRDQFLVDVYQAGAGTSHNMNVNEVLANRANELLGAARGAYAPVHPNDHVNMAQSTNDVIPTAMRLATLATLPATFSSFSISPTIRERGAELLSGLGVPDRAGPEVDAGVAHPEDPMVTARTWCLTGPTRARRACRAPAGP